MIIYSLGAVFSKVAADEDLFSLKFCLCYTGIIVTLVIYALGWQQIIKRIPLTVAFANKAVTVVWGLIWGVLFFSESITIGKLIGALMVIVGVITFAFSNDEKEDEITNQ